MRSVLLFFRWGMPSTVLGTVTIGVIRLSQLTVGDALIGSVVIGVKP